VRERGGRFAASQGYVRTGGQWRQKPGPGNALGQMKLVMPNPYKVYLHDTPSKALFSRDTRAFSHGCVRVGDAIGFAATLLSGTRSRAPVDAAVRSRVTVTYDLPARLPVYITYFTAAPAGDGTVQFRPDIYARDARVGAVKLQHPPCSD
jgi:murein L,D-transpeptidase YcbB/YkuD